MLVRRPFLTTALLKLVSLQQRFVFTTQFPYHQNQLLQNSTIDVASFQIIVTIAIGEANGRPTVSTAADDVTVGEFRMSETLFSVLLKFSYFEIILMFVHFVYDCFLRPSNSWRSEVHANCIVSLNFERFAA